MNGKDLIIYILSNNLENEPVFKDGTFIGFMTAANFAEKMNVGVATVNTWVKEGYLDGVEIGGVIYIPADLEVNK